jgi:two-component system chemotaxis sensor kinase CheA
MDVVKRNIQALRGTVDIRTEPGVGSRFIIHLPLTLAIIDGFLTSVDRASYVIPLDSVVECLELRVDDTRGHMLNLRGEVLPFVRLREFFEVEGEAPPRENVVVIAASGRKVGIVVDQLLGEFQTVIKPLGSLFRHLRGIGGSTILGSGEVALILDVQALTQLAMQSEDRRHNTANRAIASSPLISEKG